MHMEKTLFHEFTGCQREKSNYFLNHFPPDISEITTKAIAIHENAVSSVAIPIARNARPRMRKILDERWPGLCFVMLVIIHKVLKLVE